MAYTRLDINLTCGTTQSNELSDELICRYLGGRGLNARLIRDILKENHTDRISAFDPANVITMSCGLLTGTGAPSGARMHLNTISPLTDILGSSNIGGDAGTRLRSLGLFTLVITGQALRPVWVHLHKEGADIHPAGHLWGLSTGETEKALQKTLPGDSTVMSIGTAGENRCAFACIMSGNHHSAGRTGIGAVMGAKNIKAIVITGKKEIPKLNIAQKATVRVFTHKIMKAPLYPVFSKLSNSGFVIPINDKGMLSTRNYNDIKFEGAENVDGSAMMKYVQKSATCPKCPVHCKADIKISAGRYQGTTGARPDLEPIIALGPKCGLDDPEAILYLHNLCNCLGLDVISAGSVAAFAMDLFNRGIIDMETTGGIDLSWGNADGIEQLLNAIATDTGIGSTLKQGSHKAAQAIGNGAADCDYTAKGLEFTGYDPRGMMGVALGYAVSSRGGDFCSVYNIPESRFTQERAVSEFGTENAVDRFSLEGKAALIQRCMAVSAVIDSLGLCKVPALSLVGEFDLKNEAALVTALTNLEMNFLDLLQAGESIITEERWVNLALSPAGLNDTISEKFLTVPIDEGPAKGSRVSLDPMLAEFYQRMGWDENGVPQR